MESVRCINGASLKRLVLLKYENTPLLEQNSKLMKPVICIVKLNISDLAFTTPKIPVARGEKPLVPRVSQSRFSAEYVHENTQKLLY